MGDDMESEGLAGRSDTANADDAGQGDGACTRRKRLLVQTVGTGPSVHQSLLKTIADHRPDRVLQLCTHAWFGRRASRRKSRQGPIVKGPEVLGIHRKLATHAGSGQIQPQPLPKFHPDSPFADVVFGFDIEFGDSRRTGHRSSFGSPSLVDPNSCRCGLVRAGGMRSPNADDRRRQREAGA